MASRFGQTKDVIRDHDIEGYECRIFISGDGIRFQRKGDKHRDKKHVTLTWGQIAELGAEKLGVSFYSHLGFDE